MSIPVIMNDARAMYGNITPGVFHAVDMNWIAENASPTVLVLSPHVNSTGNRSGRFPRLNMMALKKMKKSSCAIRLGILYLMCDVWCQTPWNVQAVGVRHALPVQLGHSTRQMGPSQLPHVFHVGRVTLRT